MCLVCMLQYMGSAMGKGVAGLCGARQVEYAITNNEDERHQHSQHDWRYYLCCKCVVVSRSARLLACFSPIVHGRLPHQIKGYI